MAKIVFLPKILIANKKSIYNLQTFFLAFSHTMTDETHTHTSTHDVYIRTDMYEIHMHIIGTCIMVSSLKILSAMKKKLVIDFITVRNLARATEKKKIDMRMILYDGCDREISRVHK